MDPGNPHTFLDLPHQQLQYSYITSNGEKLIYLAVSLHLTILVSS